MSSGEALRVVLLGKTGAGKSSLGNSLLGRGVFRVTSGMGSGTQRCQWGDAELEDTKIEVTDTPGVCDTHREEEDVLHEVGKSVALCSPGPHVILMVLRSDRRFTDEEFNAYKTLKDSFGVNIRQHMIIVFTAIDMSKEPTLDRQRAFLEGQMLNCPPLLQQVLDDAGGRYMGINNLVTCQPGDSQTDALVKMMKELAAKNSNRYYSNEVFAGVNSVVVSAVERMMQKTGNRKEAVRQVKESIADEKGEKGEDKSLFKNIRAIIFVHCPKLKSKAFILCSLM